MKSSLYTCIQDIQNGDREQALALLEKFSPLLKKYAFFLQSEDALRVFNVSYYPSPKIYNLTS